MRVRWESKKLMQPGKFHSNALHEHQWIFKKIIKGLSWDVLPKLAKTKSTKKKVFKKKKRKKGLLHLHFILFFAANK